MSARGYVAPGIARTERGLVIAGTRITLYDIMDYLMAKKPLEEIRRRLVISEQQLNDALAHIEAHHAEVGAEYQEVLRGAEEEQRYWEQRNRERFAQIAAKPPPPGKEAIWAKLQAARARRTPDQ